jgi:ribosomal protein L7/L12
MYIPVWALILLGLGCLGFLVLLFRPRGTRDLTQVPRMPSASARMAPAAPPFTLPPGGIPPEIVAELREMIARNQKIHAIRRLRELTGCGLAEAKDRVDRL